MNPTDPSQDPSQDPSHTPPQDNNKEYTEISPRKKPIDKAMILSWGISLACCSFFLLIAALIVIDVMQEEKETEIAYEHAQEVKQEPPKPTPPPSPPNPFPDNTFNPKPNLPLVPNPHFSRNLIKKR